MYIRKTDRPRIITLPDGTILSVADLPPVGLGRWVASRKAVVVRAVLHGLLTRSEAIERYDLSEEEFGNWMENISRHGTAGLKVAAIPQLRQSKDHNQGL
ncbi:DUF1153 domain-containing protein [Paracoccus pacificus]|uniref:DUF1153 domain-containing protein n=1 Tax=Paracoccus pacificus TaxID=1463598 RepID=A0ABW4R4K5_9RHOB